jgi:predicted glycoside hydrolase/deacetylase ChbG (UPF0249 family)
MKTFITHLLSFCLLGVMPSVSGQQQVFIAKKLGYPTGTKLLIIHADDMGMSHSTNMACIKAFEEHILNSGSVMVPCPWFLEIAAYLKEHPEFDAGIHLTFTSEWRYYKWGGVLPYDQISSLLDEYGYFHADNRKLMKNAKSDEIINEIRAQIDRAIAFGINPTHIDNHTGSLIASPELFKQVLAIAAEYRLPLTIPMNLIKLMAPQLASEIPNNVVVVDNYLSMYGAIATGDWKETYTRMIRNLQPGLNEMVFHLSYDNDEMKAIAIDHEEFGSAWRQKDLDFLLSKDFKQILQDNGIILTTWGEIQKVLP